ncbi:MAG: glycosyltransferase family 9 protein, partial [Blastocatellia bacterium]
LLPTLRAIRDGFKGSSVTAAASTGTVELFSAYRLADEVVDLGVVEPSRQGAGPALSALKRTLKLLTRVHSRKFDLTVDCAPRLATQLLALFAHGKTVAPIVRLPDLVDTLLGGKHGRRTRMEAASASIIRQLELKAPPDTWRFEPGPEVAAKIEETLRKQGFRGGEPLIVLYSADTAIGGAWPVARFAEVGSRLASNYGVRVVVLDQPYSSKFTSAIGPSLPKEAIKLRAPRALDLVGALARASLVITDDPAVARFSARVGSSSIDIGSGSRKGVGSAGTSQPKKGPAGVRGGVLASAEDVYHVACEQLQASRTAVLFEQ